MLLDLATGKDTLLTRHEGTAIYTGEIAPDGHAVYIAGDQDRDLAPLRGFLSIPANTSSRSWRRVKTANSPESRIE